MSVPMTPQRWRRLQELFDGAILERPEDRSHFLQTSCGEDREMLDEVSELIEIHESSSSFVDELMDLVPRMFAELLSEKIDTR